MSGDNLRVAIALGSRATRDLHLDVRHVTSANAAAPARRHYDGYGSCPLTVERGKIVLAEFGYGGKLLPTFPTWLLDGTRPTRAAWLLTNRLLPSIYWRGMLKGREWLAQPRNMVPDKSHAA